jgi:hypothetical protein
MVDIDRQFVGSVAFCKNKIICKSAHADTCSCTCNFMFCQSETQVVTRVGSSSDWCQIILQIEQV